MKDLPALITKKCVSCAEVLIKVQEVDPHLSSYSKPPLEKLLLYCFLATSPIYNRFDNNNN